MIEFANCLVRPKALANLSPEHDLTRTFQQKEQDLQRLFAQSQPDALFAQFASANIQLKLSEAKFPRLRGNRFSHRS